VLPLDGFAEPVIVPRFARTRWLAMTVSSDIAPRCRKRGQNKKSRRGAGYIQSDRSRARQPNNLNRRFAMLRGEGPVWALPHCCGPIGRSRTRRSWGSCYAKVRTWPWRSWQQNLARWRHFLSSSSFGSSRRTIPDIHSVLLFDLSVNRETPELTHACMRNSSRVSRMVGETLMRAESIRKRDK
jgi:hypothetical protein